MNGFICTKGLALSGVEYKPGDHIPAEAVLPNRVRALINQSYITHEGEVPTESRKAGSTDGAKLAALRSEVDELKAKNNALSEALEAAGATQAPTAIIIPLTADGGVYEQEAKPESIIAAAAVLQLTVEEAEKVIAETTDPVAVILIHALDSRKGVKAAAEARGKALEEESDGEA
jgi:hypothetical protein